MTQFSYDVVPHRGGWAILITPAQLDAFPTQQFAFDVSAEVARKLRFAGFALNVRTDDEREAAKSAPPREQRAG